MIRKMKEPIEAIGDERARQIAVEGWTPEHDDKHVAGELLEAGRCYYEAGGATDDGSGDVPISWPWSDEHWKPKDRRSNLVRAGALAMAEGERLDRIEGVDPMKKRAAAHAVGLCVEAIAELDTRQAAAELGALSDG